MQKDLVQMTIRVPVELWEEISILAIKSRIDKNVLIVNAIKDYLKNIKEGK